MPRSRAVLLLLLVLALLAPTAATAAVSTAVSAPAPCPQGIGIGLVEYPRGTNDPRAQQYVLDHVRPGARFSRRFQVCNGTSAPVTLSVFGAAATVSGGSFQLGAAGANELARWITVAPGSLTLQPGGRQLARATFTVPADAEAGERYAALVAELPGRPGASGIPIATRVGVRVYLDVGPGGAPKSDFVVDSLQAGRDVDGVAQVTARVRNTGKRALDLSGSLRLRGGPGGQSGGPYPAKLLTTVLPGGQVPVVVPIDEAVVAGPWTAQLVLKSGLLQRRVEAVLTFPDQPGAQALPVDVEQLGAEGDVVRPWRSLVAGAGFALVLLTVSVVRRRRTRVIR